MNNLLYAFSGTTVSPTVITATATTSIATTGKHKQSTQSLLLFSLLRWDLVTNLTVSNAINLTDTGT